MQFVVECKRLGIPSSQKWILNENYVNHGVRRFVDPVQNMLEVSVSSYCRLFAECRTS